MQRQRSGCHIFIPAFPKQTDRRCTQRGDRGKLRPAHWCPHSLSLQNLRCPLIEKAPRVPPHSSSKVFFRSYLLQRSVCFAQHKNCKKKKTWIFKTWFYTGFRMVAESVLGEEVVIKQSDCQCGKGARGSPSLFLAGLPAPQPRCPEKSPSPFIPGRPGCTKTDPDSYELWGSTDRVWTPHSF